MKTDESLLSIGKFIAEYSAHLMGAGVHTSRVVRNSKRIGEAFGLDVKHFLLASATIPGLYLFFREYFLKNLHADTKPKAKYINWLLVMVCIGIGILLTTTMFMELVSKK